MSSVRPESSAWPLDGAARRPLIAAVAAVHVLFVIAPLDVLAPIDPHRLGERLLSGELPYVDIPFEYPPLAALPFLVAGMVPSAVALSSLALQALLLELVVLWVAVRHHPEAAPRFAILSALSFPFLSGGFDAYVMASIVVSTELLSRGRRLGWWVAAAGVPVKLASATAWVWGRIHWRQAVAAGAVAVAVSCAPVLAAGLGRGSWIGYSIDRGVQMESVAASITWLGQQISGVDQAFSYRFRSWEIIGAGWQTAVTAVAAAVGGVTIAVTATRRRLDPWLASYASVLLLLLGNKVLSPQFMTWAFPLAAVLGGRWFNLHLVATALTITAYALASGLDEASVVILARNAVLACTAIWAVVSCVTSSTENLAEPGAEVLR